MTVEPARLAATIVVARPAPAGNDVEILVLRRSEAHRFAPGFVVFPGGALDPGDRGLAERWFGSPDDEARACALRELAEETGLRLTADRSLVPAGEPDGAIPSREQLPEIAHWVAPEFLPTRFDARFFAAAISRGGDEIPYGREATAAWWALAGDVLAGQRAGDIQLAWPTFKMLEGLSACRTVDDVLALRVEQVPPPLRSHVAPRPSGGPEGGPAAAAGEDDASA